MGQTLTHGVYLPDEGERNCYSGLAANWQILDNSVGTIAAHTAALAGKAPLVHTHTVSQITDFPAYGNAAGTICEGNDSRLSDARTPLSHTHTKANITDLLNSNFIPSANNSYDLGSSSYQWNNLYAKKVNTQSVNGLNPGALSLPTLNYTDTNKYIDISGGLTTTGSNQWYTPAVDGWVFIIVNNSPTFANILVFVTPSGTTPAKFIAGSGGVLEPSSNAMWCGCPAPAGSRVRIRIKDGTIEQAVFVTCQGNV